MPPRRAHCGPKASCRTSGGPSSTTPRLVRPRSRSQIAVTLPAGADINDVIVGSLDQSDFPWEDVDLSTAGLADFARTGATLDWDLAFDIDSSRPGRDRSPPQ